MLSKKRDKCQLSLFFSLGSTLNQRHPFFILADHINWNTFEVSFSSLYCQDNGRPAKPIRLMVGLLIIKHLRNLSDESVVEQWQENMYYQYFCGMDQIQSGAPCESSELVHFRKRIGEDGISLILKESIRINGKDGDDPHVSVDTTVQEKNITYPTDAKLHKKIIKSCWKIIDDENLNKRQSYKRVVKKLSVAQRFRSHPQNRSKAIKADKKIKTIAGRLVRELERNLGPDTKYGPKLSLFKTILSQKRDTKNKIYSIHEPEVQCISKGKEHKKYEFGNKVSLVITQNTGVILGAKGFRNEYDGHTLEPALSQAIALTGKAPQTATVDRGYKGKVQIGETKIQIPKVFNNKTQSPYSQKKLKRAFKRRAAIEPIIGHLKTDHRLGRNFYKGIFGDNINIMLAAAAFNFKRMMNKWKSSFWHFLEEIFNYCQAVYINMNLPNLGF
ncbi:MAG: IS5 family transposase [Daejeonella sp.]